MPREAPEADVEAPLVAPTVSFEILSPGQCRATLAAKTRTLFAAGTRLVVTVDPVSESMRLEWPDGRQQRARVGDVVALDPMPGFTLDVAAIFAAAAD